MRRNLKYMLWDTKLNEWFQPIYRAYEGELQEISINPHGSMLMRTTKGSFGQHPDDGSTQLLSDRYEVVQCTGKQDKNGVDIYEGFYLKHPEFKHPILVEWNEDDACFESPGCVSEWSSCEVVGNKYETTDLLPVIVRVSL